jgi:hypothetical protein
MLVRVWWADHLRYLVSCGGSNSRDDTSCLWFRPSISHLSSGVKSISWSFLFQLSKVTLLLVRAIHKFFLTEFLVRSRRSSLLSYSFFSVPFPTFGRFALHSVSWHIETAMVTCLITLSASHVHTHWNTLRLAALVSSALHCMLTSPFISLTSVFTNWI